MDTPLPLISVIIPNFNRGDIVAETLDSLIQQDYPNWEVWVVDDGSSDDSEKVVKAYQQKDGRFHFMNRDREPSGAPTCRNIGLEKSKGEYLIFLDSDDLLATHCLSQRVQTIQNNPELDMWVFPMLMFSEHPEDAAYLWNISNDDADLNRFLRLDAVWQTSGPIWRREAVEKIGGFTEALACWQDVDIHLKALSSGLKHKKFYDLKPDIFYRRHSKGTISQGEISSPKKLKSREKIITTAYERLEPQMNSSLSADFKVMGGSIIVGASKAMRLPVVSGLLSFGLKKGFFTRFFVFEARMAYLLYLSRLNRIGVFNAVIESMIKKYRLDSNIGSIKYSKTKHT